MFSSPGCVVTNVSYYNGARGSGDGGVQVTHNKTEYYAPSCSPDGKKIAYTGCKGNDHGGDIHTINVGGGGKFPESSTTTRTKPLLPGESSVAASPPGEEGDLE